MKIWGKIRLNRISFGWYYIYYNWWRTRLTMAAWAHHKTYISVLFLLPSCYKVFVRCSGQWCVSVSSTCQWWWRNISALLCWTQLQPWLPSAVVSQSVWPGDILWWFLIMITELLWHLSTGWWTDSECYHHHHPRGHHQLPSTTTPILIIKLHIKLSSLSPRSHYTLPLPSLLYLEFLSDQIRAWDTILPGCWW